MNDANPFDFYGSPQTLVDVDARKFNLCVSGAGATTIVLAHGGGGSTFDWRLIQPALSEHARVIAYDRAGSGFSDPGPLPRTTSAIVADLRAALTAVGARPPYVMVGHSSGSFDARLFAFRHPDEVSGLVLVDGSGDHQDRRFAAAAGPATYNASELFEYCVNCAERGSLIPGSEDYKRCVPTPVAGWPDGVNRALINRALSAPHWRCLASELEELARASSDDLVAARISLGDMPIVALTAGKEKRALSTHTPELSAAYAGVWRTMHEEFAALSSRGEQRTVSRAGHFIQLDRPDAVIEAVVDVMRI